MRGQQISPWSIYNQEVSLPSLPLKSKKSKKQHKLPFIDRKMSVGGVSRNAKSHSVPLINQAHLDTLTEGDEGLISPEMKERDREIRQLLDQKILLAMVKESLRAEQTQSPKPQSPVIIKQQESFLQSRRPSVKRARKQQRLERHQSFIGQRQYNFPRAGAEKYRAIFVAHFNGVHQTEPLSSHQLQSEGHRMVLKREMKNMVSRKIKIKGHSKVMLTRQ